MADRVGQILGNYRLVCLLGQGGQASVYLGEHLHLKNYAAIKVLRTEMAEKDCARFLAEGQTLARLTHPQIVRISDFAVEQGTPFLVMDYAAQGTLRQKHPRGTWLALGTVVHYVKQAASALQYAHNRNVIHRDIKPENMLLGNQQDVLLSDFGLALFTPSPEQLSTQEMAGTLPYMAPEQLQGKPYFASDQYALGIVVYEWLCGVRPFDGPYWQLLNQHMSAPPPPLREKDPSLPEAVERVVLKALSKDPKERYVSVQTFAQALERASKTLVNQRRDDAEVTGRLFHRLPAPAIKTRQVFLSGAHADHDRVLRLQYDLQERGITAESLILNRQEQENTVRQAIRAAESIVLVVSAYTRTSHVVKEHLRIAALYQRRVVCVWVEGEELSVVWPEIEDSMDVIDARATSYQRTLDELVICLAKATTTSPALYSQSTVEISEPPRNPYKGLRAFSEGDTGDFFGREKLIAELLKTMQERVQDEQAPHSPARLLPVIGPSGSGKSSVVLAGLLPRLQQGALAGSQEWVYLNPMVPGAHPLEALALTLVSHLPDRSLRSIREDLEDDSARGLHLLARQIVQDTEKKVILFVDQFEEAFSLTTSEAERQRFFELLQVAITERQGPVCVLLTFRADFYDRLMSVAELGRLIEQCRLAVIWPMEADELRAAIKGPAGLPDVDLSFEGDLVGDLLYEVRGQVGALPLLQFTLDQLFERRKDHLLTQQAYREIGGVKGALAKHAEKTYQALPTDAHREAARTLFLRLIEPGQTEQDITRRRATLTETILVDSAQTRLMQETMDLFVQARLLTTNTREGMVTTIEVSHETLIREWPRLVEWLHTARDDIHLQHTISEDATTWEMRKRQGDRLYRGSQLKEAQAWARRNTASQREHAFLRAGAARQRHAFLRVVAVLMLALSGVAGWLVWYQLQLPKPDYVTTTDDNVTGSLRRVIENAHSGDKITFAPNIVGQTIVLKNTDVGIFQRNLTIEGPSTGHITIHEIGVGLTVSMGTSATISGLIFHGDKNPKSLISNFGTLRLTDSTVSGNSNDNGGEGGGIWSSGTLTMTNSTVSGNTASNGGGIWNNTGGTLTMTNSTVSGNTAPNGCGGIVNLGTLTMMTNSTVFANTDSGNTNYRTDGGGIWNDSHGTLTMTHSTVSGNIAKNGDGGGIWSSGMLTIANSTVSNNTASYGQGGGINNSQGTLTMANSTVLDNTASFSNNTASLHGGGINNFQGMLTIANSTVSNNTAPFGHGGGINSFQGTLTIANSTVSNNTAPSSHGGGIDSADETLTMTNSTVSDNAAPDGGGIWIVNDNTTQIASTTIIFCTIVNNGASGSDGFEIATSAGSNNAQGVLAPFPHVKIEASIVGGSDTQGSPITGGGITSGGYNVIQDMFAIKFASGAADATNRSVNDLTGVFGAHPQLKSNGGPTPTFALLQGSQNPALNRIPPSVCQVKDIYDTQLRLYTDQRGMVRPGKGKQACDSGAYESQG